MDWFMRIERYYGLGCYDKGDVWDFVSYKKLTEEQYTEITEEEYSSERLVIVVK